MMRWAKGPVSVERIGGALWIEAHGEGILVDAPAGTAQLLGDRTERLRSVLLLSGRIERVSGLVSVLAALPQAADVPLVLRFPLSDERAGVLAEAWQRGWGDFPVTLDGVAPGETFDVGPAEARSVALRHPRSGPPPMGVQVLWAGAAIAILPQCLRDGAARSICRDADLVVCELGGGGLSTAEAVQLSGDAELWLDPMPTEQ